MPPNILEALVSLFYQMAKGAFFLWWLTVLLFSYSRNWTWTSHIPTPTSCYLSQDQKASTKRSFLSKESLQAWATSFCPAPSQTCLFTALMRIFSQIYKRIGNSTNYKISPTTQECKTFLPTYQSFDSTISERLFWASIL